MSNFRTAIIQIFKLGKRQCEIVQMLGVSRQLVSKTIKRYQELGHEGDRALRPWIADGKPSCVEPWLPRLRSTVPSGSTELLVEGREIGRR